MRLPLTISALVFVVLGSALWVTNKELESALLRTAGERAQAASDQVSALMAQGTTRGLNEVRRLSADPAVQQYLTHPAGDAAPARQVLTPLAVASQPAVELWTADGTRVLQVEPARGKSRPLDGRLPLHAGLTPFQVSHDIVFYGVIAEVTAAVPDDGPKSAPGRLLGYLVIARTLNTAQTTDTINRLVGSGAFVAIGHPSSGIWTDFSKALPPPPVDATHNGVSTYRKAGVGDRLGAISLIAGTPWAAWIEFPRDGVLAPARALRRRLLLWSLVLVVASGLVAGVVSARITTPLHELMRASGAIASGEYGGRVRADRHDEIGGLAVAFNAMTARVETAHQDLESRVRERTASLSEATTILEQRVAELNVTRTELEAINHELEAFSYSVSHDLRAPLRHIIGFASLLDRSSAALGDEGRRYVKTIAGAATRMGTLIDDLLAFSRLSRTTLTKQPVNLSRLLSEAQHELQNSGENPSVSWQIEDLPSVHGDPALLRLVFVNLLSNAIKYSATRDHPQIAVGATPADRDETVIFVRDNGVGFDMQYAGKLFGVFQRLHTTDEFEGTGIGLANVRRIVQRHGGRTWAEGAVNAGATFYFSLPTVGRITDTATSA